MSLLFCLVSLPAQCFIRNYIQFQILIFRLKKISGYPYGICTAGVSRFLYCFSARILHQNYRFSVFLMPKTSRSRPLIIFGLLTTTICIVKPPYLLRQIASTKSETAVSRSTFTGKMKQIIIPLPNAPATADSILRLFFIFSPPAVSLISQYIHCSEIGYKRSECKKSRSTISIDRDIVIIAVLFFGNNRIGSNGFKLLLCFFKLLHFCDFFLGIDIARLCDDRFFFGQFLKWAESLSELGVSNAEI